MARILLFACPYWNLEGVLHRRDGAAVFDVIGAVWVIGPIEIEVIYSGSIFLQIDVAPGAIGFLSRSCIAKRDEQRGSAFGGILEPVHVQPTALRSHLKVKVSVTQSAAYLARIGSEAYLPRAGISVQLCGKSHAWINGVVRETLETSPVLREER